MKNVYWISTGLVCAMLLSSVVTYLVHHDTIRGVRALGFPDFFRLQLAVLKMLAVVALLAPQTPMRIKEWAYAGVGLFYLTAIVAHIAHRDSPWISVLLVGFFGLLVTSNITLHALRKAPERSILGPPRLRARPAR